MAVPWHVVRQNMSLFFLFEDYFEYQDEYDVTEQVVAENI